MTKLVAICSNSGMIWAEVPASDLIEAAKAVIKECDDPAAYEYETVNRFEADEDGYHFYEVPDDLVIEDGTDQDTIDAVCACCEAGSVKTTRINPL